MSFASASLGFTAWSLCVVLWTGHASAGISSRKPPPPPPRFKNFTLPPLPYSYSALEPYVDSQTMHFHHDVHHAAYITSLNAILAANPSIPSNLTLSQLIQQIGTGSLGVMGDIETPLRNQAGGAWNHAFFWKIMAPPGSGNSSTVPLSSSLAEAVNRSFGSWNDMVHKVTHTAQSHFGSGWAFLVYNPESGRLSVKETSNQDNPLSPINQATPLTPILGIDVWEHAYYLKYGPKRPSYLDAWWKVVNWTQVLANYEAAKAGNLGAIIGDDANTRHTV